MQGNSNVQFRWLPLGTLAKLPPADRRLLWRALPVVAAIRAALWVMPLQRVRGLIRAGERLPLGVPAGAPVSRLEWAVCAVSRRVPGASCLTQALALEFLLRRSGRTSEVHIGIAKDGPEGLRSHAWVECEGRTLLSTPAEVADYSRLLAFPRRGEGPD